MCLISEVKLRKLVEGSLVDDTVDDRFTALFKQHKNQAYEFAVAMLGDRDAAGDIVQEIFVKMYTQLRAGAIIDKPKSWLLTSLRNLCLNRLRDSRKYVAIENLSLPSNPAGLPHTALESALQSLDPGSREAIILREYQRLSYAEIAEMTDSTVPAVRSLLYRARIALRDTYFKIIAARKER
jgi:RNA polymerase sigma-70 factor (ECF subfamily)